MVNMAGSLLLISLDNMHIPVPKAWADLVKSQVLDFHVIVAHAY